jgi:hypothetical protein
MRPSTSERLRKQVLDKEHEWHRVTVHGSRLRRGRERSI